jgi:hypothetical protein
MVSFTGQQIIHEIVWLSGAFLSCFSIVSLTSCSPPHQIARIPVLESLHLR